MLHIIRQEARREAAAAAAAEAAAEATAAAADAAKRMGLGLSDASAVMVARLLIGSLLLGPWVWPLGRVLARSLSKYKSGPSPAPSPGNGNATTSNGNTGNSARQVCRSLTPAVGGRPYVVTGLVVFVSLYLFAGARTSRALRISAAW